MYCVLCVCVRFLIGSSTCVWCACVMFIYLALFEYSVCKCSCLWNFDCLEGFIWIWIVYLELLIVLIVDSITEPDSGVEKIGCIVQESYRMKKNSINILIANTLIGISIIPTLAFVLNIRLLCWLHHYYYFFIV